jgi:hypothetical protein
MEDSEQRSARWARLVLALIVPPYPALIATFLFLDLASVLSGDGSQWENHAGILVVAAISLIVAYPAMIGIGSLAHLALYRVKLRQYHAYAVSGAAIGMLVSLLVTIPHVFVSPEMLTFGAVNGILTATLFWLIRRPDRDALRAADYGG